MTTTITSDAAVSLIATGMAHGLAFIGDSAQSGPDPDGHRQVAAVELLALGFLVAPDDLRDASFADTTALVRAAAKVSGADRAWVPMYPGFPAQVRDMSTLHLLVDQIVHYLTGAVPVVDRATLLRPGLPLADALTAARPLRVVSIADEQE